MKRTLYIILVIVEAVLGVIALLGLTNWITWAGSIALGIAVAVVLVLLTRRLKRLDAEDVSAAKKLRCWIALTLLIPTAVFVVFGVVIVIALVNYFG